MEIIKFRAWDERTKRMINWDEICDGVFTFNDLKFDFVKWMQYIGLKDKNKKDICEGDIVCGEGEEGKKCVGVVIYKYPAKFGVEWEGNSWGDDFEYLNELEVIGNKFENEDLLGGELNAKLC